MIGAMGAIVVYHFGVVVEAFDASRHRVDSS